VSLCYAVLIDWGFLKYKLHRPHKPAGAEAFRGFLNERLLVAKELSGMRLHRIYFYDAVPFTEAVETPLGGPVVDFSTTATASRNKSLHADLSQDPFMALRLGELSFNGWTVKKKVLRKSKSPVTVGPNAERRGYACRHGHRRADAEEARAGDRSRDGGQ
jgi:hypothetical protein